MFASSRTSKGLQGRHVLGMMLAFFGVVFAVNGIFLYSALSTHTGVVAQEPYRKGLQYNQRISAAAKQDRLGWHEEVALAPGARGLTLKLARPDGAPVAGLKVAGMIGRPSTNQHDLSVSLRETSPGSYSAALEPLEAGAWIVSLEASEAKPGIGEEIVFRTRKRLWLKP
jgi:nitrogen fixation protein FixH